MKILLIKMSSLGDIIHTFPALTEAFKSIKNLEVDWVVEENFQAIAALHPAVKHIIPIGLRRWRKKIGCRQTFTEVKHFLIRLRQEKYDYVVDAQGLLKSGLIAFLSHGKTFGMDGRSAREAVATIFYRKRVGVEKDQHAIVRTQRLFAKIFQYHETLDIDYGLQFLKRKQESVFEYPASLFIFGTTWPSKQWPLEYWRTLIKKVGETPYHVLLPWGNLEEEEFAQSMAKDFAHVHILPRLRLDALVDIFLQVRFVVAVDTGLAHLAAALSIPVIGLYGPTSEHKTGLKGSMTHVLQGDSFCAPCYARECTQKAFNGSLCFQSVSPEKVWSVMESLLK